MNRRRPFYSPHYWECMCQIPEGIHRTSVVKCIECDLTQNQGTKVNVLDLLDYGIDPYPLNCADVISQAKVAMDIISEVTTRHGHHSSIITDELLKKRQRVQWISGREVGIVTDGIGLFIAQIMNEVRSKPGGTITAMAVYKFDTGQDDDSHFIFIGVAVNGSWTIANGMNDFTDAGERAFEDMKAILAFWSWLYDAEIETWQYSAADHIKLMVRLSKMLADSQAQT